MDASGNPFKILGLAERFDLSSPEVNSAYLRAAARNHPDRFTDPAERAAAEGRIAAINEAKAALLDDEARAGALLKTLGGPSKEEERGLPPGLLMEMMEVRTAMEEEIASGRAEAREKWKSWALARRAEHVERVRRLFAQCAVAPEPGTLREIRIELNAWRYAERMIEQLDPAYGHGEELKKSGGA